MASRLPRLRGSGRLHDISPTSKNWCMRAHIARMWDYCGARNGQPALHLDSVLVDKKGDVMYAEAGGRDVDKVRSAVEEGDVYSFSKFLVVNMKPSYKPFCAKYMIKLTAWTKMDRVEPVIESFPRFVFHLSPLYDLSSRVESQAYFTGR
uniref:Replication protein A 70 kDa DNA-binding subunit B/D first OB fold domain-containing protein n=1 Tax=Setaria viridis TaxID=4556 RepID=A0A4U6VFB2_SETVI|nr:hypothetical protein SEVIR_3G204300v2 [Setaria viridis]